jgi:hypothetical protein
MDANCPKCGEEAVPIDPYEWEQRDGVTAQIRESYKHVYWSGMTLFACLRPECEIFFLVHPKDA